MQKYSPKWLVDYLQQARIILLYYDLKLFTFCYAKPVCVYDLPCFLKHYCTVKPKKTTMTHGHCFVVLMTHCNFSTFFVFLFFGQKYACTY